MNSKLEQIEQLKRTHPNNLAVQCFDRDYYHSIDAELQQRLLACMKSGIDNPDSEVGCYARLAEDYEALRPFFSKIIAQHHGIDPSIRHQSGWSLPQIAEPDLDIAKFDLAPVSVRMRVGRNFADLPLTSAMNAEQRLGLENRMIAVFDKLQSVPGFAGQYVSLTPDHASQLSDQNYKQLIDDHVIFKNMDTDPYLTSAGIASDWPHGRGCYYTDDHSFIVWVGEEDHLRIMCMQTGTKLKFVLDRLHEAIGVIEALADSPFALSPHYGAITTCPTNLGTGMRASVHLQLPGLTADGTAAKVKQIASPLGLAVRGLGGEHTPVGSDGTVDISPRARLCITEGEIAYRLYKGIKELKQAEDQLS